MDHIKNKIIETYKVQSIIIYQPVWYKKYNLGSLALLTAGGLVNVGVFNYKSLELISNNVALSSPRTFSVSSNKSIKCPSLISLSLFETFHVSNKIHPYPCSLCILPLSAEFMV